MIKRKWLRLTLGTILGGLAGLSLTSSILPAAVAATGVADSFFIRYALSDYAAHTTLVWAVGGWAVAKTGYPKFGAIILGLVGTISGVLLTIAALKATAALLLIGGLTGGFYGLIGGLLLGNVLQAGPPQGETERKG